MYIYLPENSVKVKDHGDGYMYILIHVGRYVQNISMIHMYIYICISTREQCQGRRPVGWK